MMRDGSGLRGRLARHSQSASIRFRLRFWFRFLCAVDKEARVPQSCPLVIQRVAPTLVVDGVWLSVITVPGGLVSERNGDLCSREFISPVR